MKYKINIFFKKKIEKSHVSRLLIDEKTKFDIELVKLDKNILIEFLS